jgi:ELWxxDGT repeat protein
MIRWDHSSRKVRSFLLLSLLACGGVAAQTLLADTATLRQPRPVPGLEDPYPWSRPASPSSLVRLRDEVVYAAGRDLWASDGTTAGTHLLATLCQPYCSQIVALGHGDDLAFFAERTQDYADDFSRERVVRTDGSPAGTFRVTETFTVGYSDFVCPSARVGERLYFSRLVRVFDRFCELWSSDGTATGTAAIDPEVAVQSDLVPLGDEVYFLGTGPAARGLWRASAETGRIELVRAFHTSSDTALSHLMAEGGRLFFFGPAASLWTSDGTTSGTLRLTRFVSHALLAGLGGRAWFVADDGHGEELWSSDGSVDGTRPATDFADPHPFQVVPLTADKLAWLGGRLVFPTLYRGHVRLWSTSANSSGAQRVAGCPEGCPVVAPLPLAALGRRAVLVGLSHDAPAELWVTDGSGPGTRRLKSARGFSGLTAAGGGVLFLERNEEGLFVGVTDGTPAGTAGRLPAADPARANLAPAVAVLGGRLLFPALDRGGGGALWAVRPGGTAAQEVFLPPPHAAQPEDAPGFTFENSLALVGRAGDRALAWKCDQWRGAFFAADARQVVPLLEGEDRALTCEDVGATPAGDGAVLRVTAYSDAKGDSTWLWATDGTRAGTFPVSITSDNEYWFFDSAIALADRAVFTANEGSVTRLWHSDGTAAGTGTEVELPDRTLWQAMGSDGKHACFLDLHFDSGSGSSQRQLWCGDGTASGTRAVGPALTDPRLVSWTFSPLAPLGGKLYLCNYLFQSSLFAIAGQELTEIRLDDLQIQLCSGLTAAAGRLWFSAESDGRQGLYVSDGTATGTVRLAELPGPRSDLIPFGGAVLFTVSSDAFPEADRSRKLWRSDGTVSGTRPLIEMAPPTRYELSSYPIESFPVVAGGRLWFAGFDREHGAELWSTDGTAAGTRLETDLAPGPAWSSPRSLVPIGDKLYFVADDTERDGIWVLEVPGGSGSLPGVSR